MRSRESWWAMTDSNRRHPACKAGALPTELIARHQRHIAAGRPGARAQAKSPEHPRGFALTIREDQYFVTTASGAKWVVDAHPNDIVAHACPRRGGERLLEL